MRVAASGSVLLWMVGLMSVAGIPMVDVLLVLMLPAMLVLVGVSLRINTMALKLGGGVRSCAPIPLTFRVAWSAEMVLVLSGADTSPPLPSLVSHCACTVSAWRVSWFFWLPFTSNACSDVLV